MDAIRTGWPGGRLPWLDRWRGCAVLLMAGYHFCFDLDQYGWIHQDFNTDWRWLGFRAVIVTLFMAALGISLALRHGERIAWDALLRRQLRLGAAALLVTAGSAWMFPQSFIWFGILHFAWVATLLALALRRLPGTGLLALALVAAWAGNGPAHPAFDQAWLGWIGFMTHKPYTEDYVPVFPWIAAVLAGLALARLLPAAALRNAGRAAAADERRWLADRCLQWIGRHTLLIYLAHQPLLFALLELVRWVLGARST